MTTEEIAALGPWFHNLHLPDGTQTAPDHFLGDFPTFKWEQIRDHLPERPPARILKFRSSLRFRSHRFEEGGAAGLKLSQAQLKKSCSSIAPTRSPCRKTGGNT